MVRRKMRCTSSGWALVATSQSLAGRPRRRSRTQPPTICAPWPAAARRRQTSRAADATSSRFTSPPAQPRRFGDVARPLAEAGVGAEAARQLQVIRDLGEHLERALEELAGALTA